MQEANNRRYFNKTQYGDLKGLDLKVDQTVQELCKVSNSTSSSSRSVLYVLLLICIISVIAVVNTLHDGNFLFNWKSERLKVISCLLDTMLEKQDKIKKGYNPTHTDTVLLSRKIDSLKSEETLLRGDIVSNVQDVRVPIVGDSFDVNDLAVIGGISIIILLTVLLVTTRREKYNLRIALHAITERYPPHENYLPEYPAALDVLPDKMVDQVTKQNNNTLSKNEQRWAELAETNLTTNLGIENNTLADVQISKEFIDEFNLTRRRYHYNFLSMNEIFTQPINTLTQHYKEKFKQENFDQTFIGGFVKNGIFYFPFLVYVLIIVNDLISYDAGFRLSPLHTLVQYFFSFIFLNAIAYLSYRCSIEKKAIQNDYDGFYKKGFLYVYQATETMSKFKGPLPFLVNYTHYYTVYVTWLFIRRWKIPEFAEKQTRM